MIIQKVRITKKQLDLLPEKERVLFIQIGHLANELITLTKLLIFAQNKSDVEALISANMMQTLVIVRLCIGKLFEGWQLLQKNFFGNALSKKYEGKLSEVGDEALQNLKKYFGRKNIISQIRDNFSFHNPEYDEIKNLLDSLPEEAEIPIYLQTQVGNCNYYLSEEIISKAMLKYIDTSNPVQAFERMYKELREVNRWFIDFCGYCMVALIDEYWKHLKGDMVETINVEPQANLREFSLPVFVEKW